MAMLTTYNGRYPINLDLVHWIELSADTRQEPPRLAFHFRGGAWARWRFDSVEERDYVFAHLPVAEVAPLYPPITPKETA